MKTIHHQNSIRLRNLASSRPHEGRSLVRWETLCVEVVTRFSVFRSHFSIHIRLTNRLIYILMTSNKQQASISILKIKFRTDKILVRGACDVCVATKLEITHGNLNFVRTLWMMSCIMSRSHVPLSCWQSSQSLVNEIQEDFTIALEWIHFHYSPKKK